jgi:hypothetical protein
VGFDIVGARFKERSHNSGENVTDVFGGKIIVWGKE